MSEIKEFKMHIEELAKTGFSMDYACREYTGQKKKHWWKSISRIKAYDIISDIYAKYEKN